MRRFLLLPFVLLLGLLAAAPAMAAPTTIGFSGVAVDVTAGMSVTEHVTITQPAGDPDPYSLAAAPLQLQAAGGFTITSVTAAADSGVTPPLLPEYPAAGWQGTLDLADGASTAFDVTLKAPAAPQAPIAPLSVSIGGQADDDGDPETAPPVATGAAFGLEVIATQLELDTSTTPVFPTRTTTRTVTIGNNSNNDWSSPLSVELALPAGLTIANSPAGLSGTTWTVPILEPGEEMTLNLTLLVAGDAAAGPLTLQASAPGAAPVSSTVTIAPRPSLSIEPLDNPLEVGGASDVVVMTVANSASIGTGTFNVPITLPAGLNFVSAQVGAGSTFVAATRTWQVSAGAGAFSILRLRVAASAVPTAQLIATPDSFGIAPVGVTVEATVPVVVPRVTINGPSTQVFPTKSTGNVTVTLHNDSATDWTTSTPVTLAYEPGLMPTSSNPALSGNIWTAPPVDAGASVSLTLQFAVLASATAGATAVTATPAGGAAATYAVNVAPRPVLSIEPLENPLEVGGASDVVVITVTNSAAIATGMFNVPITLPAGLNLVSAQAGAGNNFTAPDTTWHVSVAPGAASILRLTVKASAVPTAQLVATPNAFGMPPVGLTVEAVVPVVAPRVTISGPSMQVFPTKTTDNVTVTLHNDGVTDWTEHTPVTLAYEPGLTPTSSNPALVGDVWSAPAVVAGGSVSLTLQLAVAASATAGAKVVAATPVGGAAATYFVNVAPKPVLSLIPLSDPLVVTGDPDVVVVTLANNASISSGSIPVSVELPDGLTLVSQTRSSGTFEDTGSAVPKTWTVGDLAPNSFETLRLTVKATKPLAGPLKLSSSVLGIEPNSKTIPVVPKVAAPAASFGGSTDKLFPTGVSGEVQVLVYNGSSEPLPSGPVTLELSSGLSVAQSSAPLTGLVWNAPLIPARDSVELTLTLKVAAGTAPGPGVIKATPANGAQVPFTAIDVAPVPKVSISAPPEALQQGGAPGAVVITVTNSASIKTDLLALALVVPSPLKIVQPAALSGNIWAVGSLLAGESKTLQLAVAATGSGSVALGAQLNRYGAPLVEQLIAITPAPVTPVTPPVKPVPPVTPPVVKPTPAPKNTLTLVVGDPSRSGTAYTYRGELKFRGAAMTKATCKASKLQLIVWKVKGSKPKGKAADRVGVALTYLGGHCVFGTRYAFFKKFKGKKYLVQLRASTTKKLAVPGASGVKPPTVTLDDRLTVGK
jgi:hypothetical protein